MEQRKQCRELVLASASPRRREILSQLGVQFRVLPSGIDERLLPGETPDQHVQRLAREKAVEVRERLRAEATCPVIVAADTLVLIDDQVLGKPDNDDEAVAMLLRLSGRTHRVLTALALCEVGCDRAELRLFQTDVEFRKLTADMARAYVASGEGRDKAGSYAIQGIGAGLVHEIRGSYSNVVGMPAAETIDLLLGAGVLVAWP